MSRRILIKPGLTPRSVLRKRRRSSTSFWQGMRDHDRLVHSSEEGEPLGLWRRSSRLRALCAMLSIALCFVIVSGQLVIIGLRSQNDVALTLNAPLAVAFARPDIVDRNGQLLATDIIMPSLYADPTKIIDVDDASEKLVRLFPVLNAKRLRRLLSDKSRRFVWINRGVSPKMAKLAWDAGIPGLYVQEELKRAYPAGRLGGHVVGHVDVDNKGLAGIERYLDENNLVEPVHGAQLTTLPPVRLSLDFGVQHALESELESAVKKYEARGGAGVILDVNSGEVLASASLPGVDPLKPRQYLEAERADRLTTGAYELGSVFKLFTVALALDDKIATPRTLIDTRKPLREAGFTIKDRYRVNREISVQEIFVRSSNVGSARLALEIGGARQKSFYRRLGLLDRAQTEVGPMAPPRFAKRWGRLETITASYGHGIAVAPLQFASAAAAIVNGGYRISPTYFRRERSQVQKGERVVSEKTSAEMRTLLHQVVSKSYGTGRRADVPGYRVGGKTGTAEMPGKKGYRKKSVIASFFAAFPMDQPRYVVLVSIFKPRPTGFLKSHITAGQNSAPTTARIIGRVAPMLGVRADQPRS